LFSSSPYKNKNKKTNESFNPVKYGGVVSFSKQNVTAESLEEKEKDSKGNKIAQC
jgi:hypothetical protein